MPHTADCPACLAMKLAVSRTTDLKSLPFKDAAAVFLYDELKLVGSPGHALRTCDDHKTFAATLNRFFAGLVLQEIHEGHVISYQKQRLTGAITGRLAGPDKINHEVSFLLGLRRKANLPEIPVPRLHVPKSSRGRALEQHDLERLIVCAASNPRWRVAYLGSLLTVNCAATPGEIRHLRVKDIDMRNKVVKIREGIKNEYRSRNVPFTQTIKWISEQLLKRYELICRKYSIEYSEDHYVLPRLQNRKKYDPTKKAYDPALPMLSWRDAWERLRLKAALPKLRMYDLRHHAGTALMEDESVSEMTVESIMGHGTREMKKDYEHIRNRAKKEALERHEVKPAPLLITSVLGLIQVEALPAVVEAAGPPEAPCNGKATGAETVRLPIGKLAKP